MRKTIILLLIILLSVISYSTDYEIKLTLTSDIKDRETYYCNTTIDAETNKNKFNKPKETINKDIEQSLNISCSRQLKQLDLQILNNDQVIQTITRKNINKLNYSLNQHTFRIDLNNYTNCKLNQDSIVTDIEDNQVQETFLKYFKIDCKAKTDLEITIRDINLTYYDYFNNISSYSYEIDKTISKPYLATLYLYDNFTKDNKCILTLDNKDKITKTFTNDLKLKDNFITSEAGNIINLNCEYKVKEIYLYLDDREFSKEYYNTKYNNISKLNINITSINKKVEPVKIEKPKVKPIVKPKPVEKPIVKPIVVKEEIIKINSTGNESDNNVTQSIEKVTQIRDKSIFEKINDWFMWWR